MRHTHRHGLICGLGLALLLWALPAGALPVTGYFEATAANNWQGTYVVQHADGTRSTGTSVLTRTSGAFGSVLPQVTTGCTLGMSCFALNGGTQTTLALALGGSAMLGALGSLSWEGPPLEVMPGTASPAVATVQDLWGTIGQSTLTPTRQDWTWNATLTGVFTALADGHQILSGIRLDFNDTLPAPEDHTRLATTGQGTQWWVSRGVPVPFGTALPPAGTGTMRGGAPTSVPEPATLLLLALGLVGVFGVAWREGREREGEKEDPS